MSFLPILNAFLGMGVLVGGFMWNLPLFGFSVLSFFFVFVLFRYDLISPHSLFISAFWLFILSEVMVFGGLFVVCFWLDVYGLQDISSSLEIPFMGCFLLLGSSATITAFHHLHGWKFSVCFLWLTLLLGVFFIFFQLLEMDESIVSLLDTGFHGTCFMVVGLHFSHVVLGLSLLVFLLFYGSYAAGGHYCNLAIWYWHFVDYIWLLVYTVVYIC